MSDKEKHKRGWDEVGCDNTLEQYKDSGGTLFSFRDADVVPLGTWEQLWYLNWCVT